MRAKALLIVILFTATALLATAPTAEARQACTYGSADPCDDHAVCVWNRLSNQWECVGYIDPCWFRCW